MRAQIRWLTAIAVLAGLSVLPVSADDQAALVKRGDYLVNGPVACANCHATRAQDLSIIPGMEFAGGFKIVDPAFEAYRPTSPRTRTPA
jgi:mono/diheme cytochrome c family protein